MERSPTAFDFENELERESLKMRYFPSLTEDTEYITTKEGKQKGDKVGIRNQPPFMIFMLFVLFSSWEDSKTALAGHAGLFLFLRTRQKPA